MYQLFARRFWVSLLAALLILTCCSINCTSAQVQATATVPVELQCEYRTDPIGIDAARPRLSWILQSDARGVMQSAYQILVASSPTSLNNETGDLWDSGKVQSEEMNQLAYAGKPLNSNQQVWWKVRVWIGDRPTEWSVPAQWTMGIIQDGDWNHAKWIAAPTAADPSDHKGPLARYETLLLRREVNVRPALKHALVHLCGLGLYELTINGKKVGDTVLAPGWTDYKKACLVDSYDITSILKPGPNALGICLGNGFYNEHGGRYAKVKGSDGPLKAIALVRLEYVDGQSEDIITDAGWKAASGPITFSSIYGGEDYDARLVQKGWDEPGFDDAPWDRALETGGPGGKLVGLSHAALPVRTMQVLTPIATTQLNASETVYDFGQNAAAMVEFKVRGPAGSSIKITPSELIANDGSINDRMCGGQSYWLYTLSGNGDETYVSKFYYRGGRYLQVEARPAPGDSGGALPTLLSIENRVIRSDAPSVGEVSTSNERYNKIYALIRWAQMSNMMSIMTDCPHREKLGWLEEDHLNGPALRYNFDMAALFTKMTEDMFDAQRANGLVPSLVPNYYNWNEGKFTTPVEWGSACIYVPWQQYVFDGDVELLKKHYDGMKKYMAYLEKRSSDHLISFGLGDWYDNHSEGEPKLTPVELTDSAFYYQNHEVMARIADVLGRRSETAEWVAEGKEVLAAFNQKYFNGVTDQYASGSQGANCLPLAFDMVPAGHRNQVFSHIIADIMQKGTTAGEVSFEYLLRALVQGGRSDLIYSTYGTDKEGYGLQVKLGKTSLTEAWNGGTASQNHFMYGQINEWFFHDLAGIQPDQAGAGFRRIIIKPAIIRDLKWVKASYRSIRGPIVSNWTNDSNGLTMNVTIPAGATATVYVPAADPQQVKESGVPVSSAKGLRFLRSEGETAVYNVGSGNYSFASALP